MNQIIKNKIKALIVLFSVVLLTSCGDQEKDFSGEPLVTYPDFTVTSINRTSAYPTTNVTITGENFGVYKEAVKVFFGGIAATTIVSCTDTQIIAQIPSNAVSGKVSLKIWTNSHDVVNNFVVVPAPTIVSVSDDAGSPGDQITITGTGFLDLSEMSISFNGTAGTINSVNSEGNTIVVTVPNGFSSGPIVLSVLDYSLTGPGFAYLVSVPDATYQLDFEDNLNATFGGTSATYTQGAGGSPLTYVTGVSGKAVFLAGAPGGTNQGVNNQILALPQNVAKYNELTVACWVQYLTADRANWSAIWEFGQTRGNKIALYGQTSRSTGLESRVIFENVTGFTGYNELFYATGTAFPASGFHHVAMTLSKTDLSMKVYIDGVLVKTNALQANYDLNLYNQTKAYIGNAAFGTTGEPAIKASIDKFQIFNSVLSENQIYTLYYKK